MNNVLNSKLQFLFERRFAEEQKQRCRLIFEGIKLSMSLLVKRMRPRLQDRILK